MEIAIISTREVIYDASLLKIGKIKVDKILHFFAGTIIALSCFLARLDYIIIFIIVFAIAFFTEIYDEFFKSKFDLLDLIATQLGFFLALLIKLIIYFFN